MTRPAPAALLGGAALAVAATAAVFSTTGVSLGAPAATRTPQEGRPLRLGPDARFPASAIPSATRAATAERIGTTTLSRALLGCPPDAAAMGTWCLDRDVRGTATPADAARVCVRRGGVVPTAARLIGAAPRVRLSSRADDRPSMALTARDGRTDLREQSSTPITSTTGSAAAGSTQNPTPATLQVVAVFDNTNRGGFAGAVPTSSAERFRCAYLRRQAGPEPRTAPAVSSVAARAGRRIAVVASVPSAGTVVATASVRSRGRTVVVAYATRTAGAGTVRLTLRPTRAGRPVLRRGRTAAVTVRVTHRQRTGVLATAARTERLTAR
jgi:hypothetical protein